MDTEKTTLSEKKRFSSYGYPHPPAHSPCTGNADGPSFSSALYKYRRRLAEAQAGAGQPDDVAQLDQQIASLQRGIGRLIDSYAEGVIERDEFEPRVTGLKARLARLQERRQAAAQAAEGEHELTAIIGRLEGFAAKVHRGLDDLD